MSKYKDRVRAMQKVQIALVIVCLVALGVFFFILTKPEIKTYEVDDLCGPIGGQISHPVDDADACSNMCRALCLTHKLEYHDSEFVLKDPACNDCLCFCSS